MWFCQDQLTLWSWALLQRSLVVRTLDNFPAFCGTRMFNTEFTWTLDLSLSRARPIQSTSPHPTSTRSILILSSHLRLGLSSGLLPLAFTPTTYTRSSSPPFVLHALPSHPRRHYSNYTIYSYTYICQDFVTKFVLAIFTYVVSSVICRIENYAAGTLARFPARAAGLTKLPFR
jgi:hypothetical protein